MVLAISAGGLRTDSGSPSRCAYTLRQHRAHLARALELGRRCQRLPHSTDEQCVAGKSLVGRQGYRVSQPVDSCMLCLGCSPPDVQWHSRRHIPVSLLALCPSQNDDSCSAASFEDCRLQCCVSVPSSFALYMFISFLLQQAGSVSFGQT